MAAYNCGSVVARVARLPQTLTDESRLHEGIEMAGSLGRTVLVMWCEKAVLAVRPLQGRQRGDLHFTLPTEYINW
jgi:hypothetical protein